MGVVLKLMTHEPNIPNIELIWSQILAWIRIKRDGEDGMELLHVAIWFELSKELVYYCIRASLSIAGTVLMWGYVFPAIWLNIQSHLWALIFNNDSFNICFKIAYRPLIIRKFLFLLRSNSHPSDHKVALLPDSKARQCNTSNECCPACCPCPFQF